MTFLRLLLPVVLLSLSPGAFAQSAVHEHPVAPVPSEALKSFAAMKTLAGEWEGLVTVKEMPGFSMRMNVSLRVTSRGNAIVHEMQEAGTPLDPTKYDHPVTMLYVDADRLTLVHYCDAGNRPRMIGTLSPDGTAIDFEFADISGSTESYMQHALFTVVDADHHTEDWTFMMKGKPVHAHFELQRKS